MGGSGWHYPTGVDALDDVGYDVLDARQILPSISSKKNSHMSTNFARGSSSRNAVQNTERLVKFTPIDQLEAGATVRGHQSVLALPSRSVFGLKV